MKVLWLDPVNRDPQFLNLLSLVLHEAGHQVMVRSNAREVFPPPPEIEWVPFSSLASFPRTFQGQPLARLRVAGTYGFDWARAALWVRRQRAPAVLVSSSLALARVDAWGLGWLRRCGAEPVVLVHKPYRDYYGSTKERAIGGAYYRQARRLLTMTDYTTGLLAELYDLPAERFRTFPHPHFQPLLDRHAVDAELAAELARWAGTDPVVTFASNMTPEHGLDDLLAALPALLRRAPRMRLLLLSSQPEEEPKRRVEAQLRQLGAWERSRCLWDPYSYGELKACIDASSVVVTPYRWATQSGVVSLAAGLGAPVVVTDVGGLPEMVRPGVTGELAPAGDAEGLAAAVARVLADAAGYRARTLASRDTMFGPVPAGEAVIEALAEASSR